MFRNYEINCRNKLLFLNKKRQSFIISLRNDHLNGNLQMYPFCPGT